MSLVEKTALSAGKPMAETKHVLDAFFDTLIVSMGNEQMIMLRPDFGYFELRDTPENMRGQMYRVPVFQKSGRLKSFLHRDTELK